MCYAALIPVALGVFGGLKSGQAASVQAGAAASNARINASFANQAADDATKRGAYDADLQRIRTAQNIGTQRTAQAANGGDVNSGSNALVQEDTASLGELDALTIANNAAREAYGYKVQALNGNINANQLEANGDSARQSSILGGVINGVSAGFGASGGSFGSMFSSRTTAPSGLSSAYGAGNSLSIYSSRATA